MHLAVRGLGDIKPIWSVAQVLISAVSSVCMLACECGSQGTAVSLKDVHLPYPLQQPILLTPHKPESEGGGSASLSIRLSDCVGHKLGKWPPIRSLDQGGLP